MTLTSSGTAALTHQLGNADGHRLHDDGRDFPGTLNPGQTATLQVTFDPATSGAETGSILITSNATTNPTATVTLSGTGDSTAGALSALACSNIVLHGSGNRRVHGDTERRRAGRRAGGDAGQQQYVGYGAGFGDGGGGRHYRCLHGNGRGGDVNANRDADRDRERRGEDFNLQLSGGTTGLTLARPPWRSAMST